MKYEPKFGDVIFIRSYGIVSRLIRLVIAVRYGLPLKVAWSHVELVTGPDEAVSAEGSGIELVKLKGDKALRKSDAVVFRFSKPIDAAAEAAMRKTIKEIVGRGYGYARYALDFLRVLFFYAILLGTIPAAIFYRVAWPYYVGAIVGFIVLEKVLKAFDGRAFDCVEVVSVVLTAGGLWQTVAFTPRSEFPDGMLQVFRNLELHGVVADVREKRIGEEL